MHVPYGTSSAYSAKGWSSVYQLVEDVDERAIDLGLSIRWASCNIGATAPEENGEYYMWADTLGGWDNYVRANYPYYKNNQYTRYNATDHRTRLIPFDDAAYIRWGETWRMPTKDEWHELFTQCIWEKEKLNDKWVYKVTGPNGNYIYIPLPGYIEGTFHSPEADGYYWTSELYSTGSPISTFISSGGTRNSGPADPSYGRSVRAVYRREWPSFTLTITDTPEGSSYTKAVNAGSSYTLTAQEDDCHTFVRWSDGNTNKTRTVTATAHATYTAVYEYVPLASGTCGVDGDNLTWTLSCDGVLTISGTGAMKDYWISLDKVPWYSYREAVKSVIVTSGVTNIGDCAFDGCSSLTSVTLPSGLVTIGKDAFSYCSELSSIIIPDNVTSIGNHAFYRCSKMSSVTFPNGLISIGQFAFGENDSLSSVTIPRSVTDVGWRAFGYWDNEYHPNDITVEWTENIPWCLEVTNSYPQSDITLHVPCEAIELYKAADGWKDYTIEGEGGPYTVTVQAEDPTMGDVSIIVN